MSPAVGDFWKAVDKEDERARLIWRSSRFEDVKTEAVRRSIDKTRGYAWGEGDGRQRSRLGHYSGLAEFVGT